MSREAERKALRQQIFTPGDKTTYFLDLFAYQYRYNALYGQFCRLLHRSPDNVKTLREIPYLPISFFKTQTVQTGDFPAEIIFTSSGTTGANTSRHYVHETALYRNSFLHTFRHFYGDPAEYCFLFLLPSYMEREGSSLIYMCEELRRLSNRPESGFYLEAGDDFRDIVQQNKIQNIPTLVLGVSFALLDLAEKGSIDLSNCIVMETGGMKGRRREPTRAELHKIYNRSFGAEKIHSEYGMTELLSQAYSGGDGLFACPPHMRVSVFETDDPFTPAPYGKTGALHIIDGANIDSCAFIATQDLGKMYTDGTFEVLGRFDHSDVRGCNLLL